MRTKIPEPGEGPITDTPVDGKPDPIADDDQRWIDAWARRRKAREAVLAPSDPAGVAEQETKSG